MRGCGVITSSTGELSEVGAQVPAQIAVRDDADQRAVGSTTITEPKPFALISRIASSIRASDADERQPLAACA